MQLAHRLQLDRVHLVAGAEPVEEVHERDPGAQRGRVGDQGEVVRLLDAGGGDHGPAGHPGGHHVGVVTEDAQRVRGQGTGGHVDHRRGQLARDLEHVGQHQQQALRSREGGTEGALGHRTVQRTGRTGLGLELNHLGNCTPQVGPAGCRPGIRRLAHRRGRGDRIDREHLTQRVRHPGSSFVAIYRRPPRLAGGAQRASCRLGKWRGYRGHGPHSACLVGAQGHLRAQPRRNLDDFFVVHVAIASRNPEVVRTQ